MCTMYNAIMMIKCLDERLIKIILHVMQMKNHFELNIFTFSGGVWAFAIRRIPTLNELNKNKWLLV